MSDQPVELWNVSVWVFEKGLHQPPMLQSFEDVTFWKVTQDNTLVIHGEKYQFVSPPGMWVSAYASRQITNE